MDQKALQRSAHGGNRVHYRTLRTALNTVYSVKFAGAHRSWLPWRLMLFIIGYFREGVLVLGELFRLDRTSVSRALYRSNRRGIPGPPMDIPLLLPALCI